MDNEELKGLLNKMRSGTASAEDYRMLAAAVKNDELGIIAEEINTMLQEGNESRNAEYDEQKWLMVANKILELDHSDTANAGRLPVYRVHFLRRGFLRYAAAILIILGIGAYFYYVIQPKTEVIASTLPSSILNDIPPGSDKAILTLAGGQQIQLDSSANSILAQKGIVNKNALLSYSGSIKNNTINSLATPRGGQYKLRLSDGTMVWLNAASSISYPTTFNEKIREVSITGEAYFEVAKDKAKPFTIKTRKDVITVLGTSFNINSYRDEPGIKTSLIDGSVRIDNTVLKPGEAYENGKIYQTDIEQDLAWKNGKFRFDDADIETVMKQLERWYNIDVVYENRPTKTFRGSMPRSLSAGSIFKILEATGGVHFTIEGNKVTVMK